MNEDPVRVERKATAAIVTLDRPQRMNSLSRATLLALGRVGSELASDPSLRAIVITGSGDRAFCAGADLKERAGMSETEVEAQLALYQSELRWIDRSRVPVVAAINGVALGGGLELALMCDLRVAANDAVLGLPETTLGIIPGAGGTQRLPRIIGEGRAKQLILFGERIAAPSALAIGLVNRVTAAGMSVVEDTLTWLEPLLRGAPIALGAALEAIDAAHHLSLEDGLQLERQLYQRCLMSEDRKEALLALAEKRPPKFEGR